MPQRVSIRKSGTWSTLPDTSPIYIRVGGTWRLANSVWIRAGGTWRSTFYQPPVTAPLNVRVTSAANNYTSLSVAWDPPTISVNVVTYFARLQACDSSGTPVGSPIVRSISAPTTSYTFSLAGDVVQNTKYLISVQAVTFTTNSAYTIPIRYQIGHQQQTTVQDVMGFLAVDSPWEYLLADSGDVVIWSSSTGSGLNNIIDNSSTIDIRTTAWTSEQIGFVGNSLGGSESGANVFGAHCHMQGVTVRFRTAWTAGAPRLLNGVYVLWSYLNSANPSNHMQDVHVYMADIDGNTIEGIFDPDNRYFNTIINGVATGQFLVSQSRWASKFWHGRCGSTAGGTEIGSSIIQSDNALGDTIEIGAGRPVASMTLGIGPDMAFEWNNPGAPLQNNTKAVLCGIAVKYRNWGVVSQQTVVTVPELNNSFW